MKRVFNDKAGKLLLLALIFCGNQISVFGQIDYDTYSPSSQKILLTDLLVVKRADQAPQKGSILIEQGKIKSIGPNIDPPFDARVIKMDSMYVYPAFIAGISNAGIEKIEDENEENVKFPGAPSNSRAGITPELSAIELFNGDNSSIDKFRSNGFAISHSVPHGKMITGTGAIFSLAGESHEYAVLKNNSSVFSQFKSANGVYPRTIIGIMAKWRDLYNNAKYAAKYLPEFKKDPVKLSRPKYDKSVIALSPITNKSVPLYFKTSNAKEVYRALSLQKELGFDLVLSETKQSWMAMDAIKKSGAKLLLTIDLPKKPKEDKTDANNDDSDKEIKVLTERKKESYDLYLKEASNLEKNNIKFAFSFLDGKPGDLHKNIQQMMASGLSPQAAFEALTSTAAKLIGMEKLAGSLDQGKLANLMITDKNYFEKGAKIKYVFVDGKMFDYSSEKVKKKKNKEGDLLNGTWKYEVDVFGETETGKLIIESVDEELTISVLSDEDGDDPTDADNIDFDGSTLTFDFVADTEMGELNLTMNISFDEDEDFEGTVTGDFGNLPIKGSKTNPDK